MRWLTWPFTDRWGDLRVGWWIAVIVLPILLLIGGLFALGLASARHGCNRTVTAMEREWRHGWSEGCLVQTSDGRYVPLDTYRLTEEEK